MGGYAQADPYRASSQMTKPKTTEVRCDRKPGHGSSAGALPRPPALPIPAYSCFIRSLLVSYCVLVSLVLYIHASTSCAQLASMSSTRRAVKARATGAHSATRLLLHSVSWNPSHKTHSLALLMALRRKDRARACASPLEN